MGCYRIAHPNEKHTKGHLTFYAYIPVPVPVPPTTTQEHFNPGDHHLGLDKILVGLPEVWRVGTIFLTSMATLTFHALENICRQVWFSGGVGGNKGMAKRGMIGPPLRAPL